MTTQLIPVFTGELSGNSVQLVDARLLHSFLESAQDFSTWIKSRIKEYGFVENVDYLLHKFMEQLPSGAKRKIDYHLTIDMAKELSMVERNDQGRKARRYFIECEQRAMNAASNPVEKPEALPTPPPTIPLNGTMVMEFQNGEAISCKPITKDTWIFDAGNEPGVKKLVYTYIPAPQLGALLTACMERMQAIALGKQTT